MHLGLGNFARAHLAAYTDDALSQQRGDWGIIGVSLNRPDQRDRLAPQDGLYTALSRDGNATSPRVIGCVTEVLFAPENPGDVIARMASPDTDVITLTVTEKGYCHDPATGRLDPAHVSVQHDLSHEGSPRSALGFLVAALRARRGAGVAPPTVITCDNLPHNGRLLAGLVRDFAALRDDALAGWIEAEVAFPCTMVDRIVPASTPADAEDARRLTGLDDEAPVSHEPFRQWVIEDRFSGSRPQWERAGAQLTADVAPWEEMKLRLLNGAHSALAYLGLRAGHTTVADTVADPALRAWLRALWRDELIPVVRAPPGTDLTDYAAALLTRFGNTAVRHRLEQIAMDGSQKLPQRILAPYRERLRLGLPSPALAGVVAAWIAHFDGPHVNDPLAEVLRAALARNEADPVRGVLSVEAVFGGDLPACEPFVAQVRQAYAALQAGRAV